jgi:hypothetical protein
VEAEHVKKAFDLVLDSVKSLEQGAEELTYDFELDAAEPEERAEPKEVTGKMKLLASEYASIARQCCLYLEQQELFGATITEEDVITWYLEMKMRELGDDADAINYQEKLISLVMRRLIDVDKVIIVTAPSPDEEYPELREIRKHPNFVASEDAEWTQQQGPFGAHRTRAEQEVDPRPAAAPAADTEG